MITTSIAFNGVVSVTLTGKDEDDKRLLELAFNGREVKRIKSIENGIVLELERATGTKKD